MVKVIKIESTTEDTASVIENIFSNLYETNMGWKFITSITDADGVTYLVFNLPAAYGPAVQEKARFLEELR